MKSYTKNLLYLWGKAYCIRHWFLGMFKENVTFCTLSCILFFSCSSTIIVDVSKIQDLSSPPSLYHETSLKTKLKTFPHAKKFPILNFHENLPEFPYPPITIFLQKPQSKYAKIPSVRLHLMDFNKKRPYILPVIAWWAMESRKCH